MQPRLLPSSGFGSPQLESPIERTRDDVLLIRRNIHSHDLALVTFKRLEPLPAGVTPHLQKKLM